MHAQGIALSRRESVAQGLSAVAKVDPVLVRLVHDYLARGVIHVFRGGGPSPPRVPGLPYKNGTSLKSYLNSGMTSEKAES